VWSAQPPAREPVEKAHFSPSRLHKETVGRKPLRRVFPFVHTPYDYNKGN